MAKLLVDNEYICALLVSGKEDADAINKIVYWVGGFIVPNGVGDQLPKWTMMYTRPVGNTDGDIIVILCDELYDLEENGYNAAIRRKLYAWDVENDW